MRVKASRALRVGRGDEVIIRARLPAGQSLGRLFVFASENGSRFAPYVPQLTDLVLTPEGAPQMRTPLSLRLTPAHPLRTLALISDIDGSFCIMQEIDRKTDPRAKIKMERTICPHLPWQQRLYRRLTGMVPWSTSSLSLPPFLSR